MWNDGPKDPLLSHIVFWFLINANQQQEKPTMTGIRPAFPQDLSPRSSVAPLDAPQTQFVVDANASHETRVAAAHLAIANYAKAQAAVPGQLVPPAGVFVGTTWVPAGSLL
jgi:hypothetical protein